MPRWDDAWVRARRRLGVEDSSWIPLLEWYLVLLPPSKRDSYIDAYLDTVSPEYREEERRQLLSRIEIAEDVFHPVDLSESESSRLVPDGFLERRIETTVQVPLFDFSAPPVDGCSMSVQTSASRGASGTWRVSLGATAGATTKVLVSFKATFNAGPGESKQVFVPVPVLATRLYRITGPGSLESNRDSPRPVSPGEPYLKPLFFHSDFDSIRILPARTELVPAVRSILTTVPNGGGRTLGEYPLGQDVTRGLAEYEYVQEATTEYKVGGSGKVHGVELSASAGVALTKRLTLKIVLVGGRDYRLKAMPDRPGVYWEY